MQMYEDTNQRCILRRFPETSRTQVNVTPLIYTRQTGKVQKRKLHPMEKIEMNKQNPEN